MMKTITLTRNQTCEEPIDVSSLRLDQLLPLSETEIAKVRLPSCRNVELGELFQVESRSSESAVPRLNLRGDCRGVHHLGHQHREGAIHVAGDIGNYCGDCMTGGTITVDGNAGDHLGGPTGTRSIGMNGGLLTVQGSVGDFAGHRMRRGEIRIAGNAGDSLAAWQVAGTVIVGGTVGRHLAYAMRRGTVVLGTPVQLTANRFTAAVEMKTPFQHLFFHRSDLANSLPDSNLADSTNTWLVSRGDRAVNGIGEIWQRG
ncbi:formylmethanofuran dehydrogenase subunit C [Rhodopirellula sallentina]|uniref:Formylmethanofuran dehydrogenase subunit C domain protein n=1 Tax=Rhodopirellula sallentina SM41 TaxID=1263870 RepID=M5TZD5_9BACT|nr:formylmethanofuran dehydrogenase subunit C [Rhodopirellula sallentina]EMI54572.1 Formylmethanofuran dehydrogenase subunit C domain protein [Rhodopirellula sallentina SM41]